MPTFAALTTQEISKLYTQQSHSILYLYTLTKQTITTGFSVAIVTLELAGHGQ